MSRMFADYCRALPTLTTARLKLRPVTIGDARDMFAYAADPEMTRHTTWPPHESIDVSRSFLRDCLDNAAKARPSPLAIELNGRMIGTCGFAAVAESNRRGELGYAIGRDYWNRGYMTEAATAIVDYAFRTLPLHRVQACCDVDNAASAKVMEKLGMTFEGVLRGYMVKDGVPRDVRYFSVLAPEWERRMARMI